jgi:hypothetical protein
MKVEILYFDGCPTYLAAEKTLHEVLEEQGIAAEVELVAVNTDEEADGASHLTTSRRARSAEISTISSNCPTASSPSSPATSRIKASPPRSS